MCNVRTSLISHCREPWRYKYAGTVPLATARLAYGSAVFRNRRLPYMRAYNSTYCECAKPRTLARPESGRGTLGELSKPRTDNKTRPAHIRHRHRDAVALRQL